MSLTNAADIQAILSGNKKLNIALTASIGDAYQAIWGSGIIQNILFLYQLYQKAPITADICLLDLAQNAETPVREIEVGNFKYKCINQHVAMQETDIVIEIGTQLWPEIAKAVQDKGGKVVSMRCGNAFIDEVMGIFFEDRQPLIPLNHIQYNQVWVLPHYGKNSAPMLQTMMHCPSKVVNYIWEPEFIELTQKNYEQPFQYIPGVSNKHKLAICEPNLNPTKTFHIPLLICEEAFNQGAPVEHAFAMNAWRYASNPSSIHFVNRLNLFTQQKMTFESRQDIIKTLTSTASSVISHHWQNGYNNLYFDVLYGNFPLVHNSEFIGDVGYYYEDFNVQDGARAIMQMFAEHDENLSSYKQRNQALFASHSIHNPKNIIHYNDLILNLYK